MTSKSIRERIDWLWKHVLRRKVLVSAGIVLTLGIVARLLQPAPLPGPEAKVFRDLAEEYQAALKDVSERSDTAMEKLAQSAIEEGDGTIEVRDCYPGATRGCSLLLINDRGPPLDIRQAQFVTRLRALSGYAAAVAELAEAKDDEHIDASKGAINRAVINLNALVPGLPRPFGLPMDALSSVDAPSNGLFTSVTDFAKEEGGPLKAVADALLVASRRRIIRERRRLLLIAARGAKFAVDFCSNAMSQQAEVLRDNYAIASEQALRSALSRLNDASSEMTRLRMQSLALRTAATRGSAGARESLDQAQGRLDSVRERSGRYVGELIAAARALDYAKALNTDFSRISQEHDQLIAKLENQEIQTDGS